MKTIGIITIHKINNYGSVLQAHALQVICNRLGFHTAIIDYTFPNKFHHNNPIEKETTSETSTREPKFIKYLFGFALYLQHKRIQRFVRKYLPLTPDEYHSPDELKANPPLFDIYVTGSDQLWSPKYCKGDSAFMLHFAPDSAKKISYAASMGTDAIPADFIDLYRNLLCRYSAISVREESACLPIENLIGKRPTVVLDPTLLLDRNYWNSIAAPHRIIKGKYILCYYLNYSFDAFPYADDLARDIQKQTGYKIIRVARPPHRLTYEKTGYKIGASPEDFLALVRDAEIILTTSFHGTAFAVIFGRPLFSIVKSEKDADSRQVNLLRQLKLKKSIIPMDSTMPSANDARYDDSAAQEELAALRDHSLSFLKNALND